MFDFIDPILNAFQTALDFSDLFVSISTMASTIINTARGVGQFIMGLFKIAQNTLSQIFSALKWFGLAYFFTSTIAMITFGFNNWIDGLSRHLDCAAAEFGTGWKNQGYIMGILAQCTWSKFETFLNGSCTRYYIVDMTFGLLYGIFVELPLILIRAILGIDLQALIDIFWNLFIVPLDSLFYALSGFHIIKWDDAVIKRCYRCKGKYTFANGREVTLYKTWAEWASLMNCSIEQIVSGFMRIFTTLVPSSKWWAWKDGKNLRPPDWNPKVLGY
jgi:hypothetical protein